MTAASSRTYSKVATVAAVELIVLLGIVIAVNIVIYRARRGRRRGLGALTAPPRLAPRQFVPDTSLTFRGGARVGAVNVTWPGSRLTFDDRRAQLRGAHPAVDISRERVTGIAGGRYGVSGITFDSADGIYDGVVFWCGRSLADVLAGLADKGWPIAGG